MQYMFENKGKWIKQILEDDKEYFVVNINKPYSKPYWVKHFNPAKHVIYKPDWPVQGNSIRTLHKTNNTIEPVKQSTNKIKSKEQIDIENKLKEAYKLYHINGAKKSSIYWSNIVKLMKQLENIRRRQNEI